MSNVVLAEKADSFLKSYCMTGRFARAEQSILHTIKYRHTNMGNAILLGESGTGKSEFAKQFLKIHAEQSTPEREKRFGIYVEAPTSLHTLYEDILQKLGDIQPDAGKREKKRERIIDLINKLDVKVIFIDEIQAVLPSAALSFETPTVVKDLKILTNSANCSWVLCGTPDARAILDVEAPMKTRFPKEIQFSDFSFKGKNNKLEFMDFMFDLLQHMTIKAPYFKCLNESIVEGGFGYFSDINYDNLIRLLDATNGCLRTLKLLLTDCIDLVELDNKLDKAALTQAYENCIEGAHYNPFRAPISQVRSSLSGKGLYDE